MACASRSLLMTLASLLSVIIHAGCSSNNSSGRTLPVNSGLAALSQNSARTLDIPTLPESALSSNDKARLTSQAALYLEAVFAQAGKTTSTANSAQRPPATTQPADTDAITTEASSGLSALASPEDAEQVSLPAPVSTPSSPPIASVATPASVLTLARVALCTRVDGFGRFAPFPTTTFLAGRPVRAILYSEVRHFASRTARAGDPAQRSSPLDTQHTVDLSQSLTLFGDADGLPVWQRSPQRAIETSLSPRTDFFLTQAIELPATLGVGKYNLKVTLRDATNGQQAEAIVPISIVADPALVARPGK